MIKLFFATIFIAELIIAIAVILKIRQLDKCVNSLNALVSSNKENVRASLKNFKWLLAEGINNYRNIKLLVKQKREEYLFGALKTSLIYLSIFLLKGKHKKGVLAFQFLREVYSGFSEVEF